MKKSTRGLADAAPAALMLLLGFGLMGAMRTVAAVVAVALVAAALAVWWRRGVGRDRWVVAAVAVSACVGGAVLVVWVPAFRNDLEALRRFLFEPSATDRSVLFNFGELVCTAWPEAALGLDPTAVVGAVITVPWLIAVGFLFRVRPAWALLLGALVVQWVLFQPAVRYVMPVLPLAMLAAWRMLVVMHRRAGEPWGGWAVYVGMAALLTANGIGLAKLIEEQQEVAALPEADFRDGKYDAPIRL